MLKHAVLPLLLTISAAAETNPCAILTDAEVRKVFPDVNAGKVDRKLEKDGMLYCYWTGKGHTFMVRADQTPGNMREEVESMALGFTDPTASSTVRYEKLKGNEIIAVVERVDKSRGIIGNAAYVGVQKGPRVVIIAATGLAGRDRAEALKILEDFARLALARL